MFNWSQVNLRHTILTAMKCDLCNQPAVVHEVTVKNGLKNEVHLCEQHAAEAGFTPNMQQPINELLTQFVVAKGGRSKRVAQKTCGTCGVRFSHFKSGGALGCPDCYEAFEDQLSPMVERAQHGGDHHVGKTPKRAGVSIDRQRQIQQLLRDLDSAVAAEQYERAAALRDQLKDMKISFPSTSTAGSSKP